MKKSLTLLILFILHGEISATEVNDANLHHFAIEYFYIHGSAPQITDIAFAFDVSVDTVKEGLLRLQEGHGVVLHPHTLEIWVMHPFSNAPTNVWVSSGQKGWWASCIWCALGVAALVPRCVTYSPSSLE